MSVLVLFSYFVVFFLYSIISLCLLFLLLLFVIYIYVCVNEGKQLNNVHEWMMVFYKRL